MSRRMIDVEKKWKKRMAVCLLALGMCMMMAVHMSAHAEGTTSETLKQIGAYSLGYDTQVAVQWDTVSTSEYTYYYMFSDDASFATYLDADVAFTGNSENGDAVLGEYTWTETFFDLDRGKKYYLRVGRSKTYSCPTPPLDVEWTSMIEVAPAPDTVDYSSVVQTKATKTSVTFKWDAVEGADGYYVVYDDCYNGGSVLMLDDPSVEIASNSVTLKGLKKNTVYCVAIYAYAETDSYQTEYEEDGYNYCYVRTIPSKIKNVSLLTHYSLSNKYITFKCDDGSTSDSSSSAVGYQYVIYNNANKKVVSGKTTDPGLLFIQTSKLKKNRYYSIKLRSYIKLGNGNIKYGAYSGTFYFISTQPSLSIMCYNSNTDGMVMCTWPTIVGATKYTISISTDKNVGYKTICTRKKGGTYSFAKSSLKLKWDTTYYVRLTIYKKVNGKTFKEFTRSSFKFSRDDL